MKKIFIISFLFMFASSIIYASASGDISLNAVSQREYILSLINGIENKDDGEDIDNIVTDTRPIGDDGEYLEAADNEAYTETISTYIKAFMDGEYGYSKYHFECNEIGDLTERIFEESYYVSSMYGVARPQFNELSHSGIDIVSFNGRGAEILAPTNGFVIETAVGDTRGEFLVYYIGDSDGYAYFLLFQHMEGVSFYMSQETSSVFDQIVYTGDVIGYMGTTGKSTGYHCHVEAYRISTSSIDSSYTAIRFNANSLFDSGSSIYSNANYIC